MAEKVRNVSERISEPVKWRRWLLPVCAFAVGALMGIWRDWYAHKHQNIVYVVTDYKIPELDVHPGDQITLLGSDAKAAGPAMDFVGNSPCKTKKPHSNTCEIDSNVKQGSYFFTCASGQADADECPDPGIHPSPMPPGGSFTNWVAMDFFLPVAQLPVKTGGGPPLAAGPTPLRAYVYCDPDTKTTALQDEHHRPMSSMQAWMGLPVFWISSDNFTLSTSTPQFCAKDPNVNGVSKSSCIVNESGQTMTYTVTASSCGALNNATVTSGVLSTGLLHRP